MNKTNYLSSRFQQGGNSGDVTIAAGSQQYAAAFGDADERDWRSTGTCFIYVRLYHNHCIYVNGYYFSFCHLDNRFMVGQDMEEGVTV